MAINIPNATEFIPRAIPFKSNNASTGGVLKFPENIGDLNRPYVWFRCKTKPGEAPLNIYFPCPQGLAFNDGAAYNTIDMGMIDTISEIANASINAFQGKDKLQASLNAAKEGGQRIMKEIESAGSLGAGILAARKLGADKVATSLELRGQVIQNPKTNTAFSGNTIRSFQFDFKMIGRSVNEVKIIDKIQNEFRNQVYAKRLNGGNIMLKYPNQWEIRFIDPRNGQELNYVPKIYSCYLLASNTIINSTSNTYRKDMSPYEVDMSLQFQETKVLTRDEIESLENNGDRTSSAQEAAESILGEVKTLTNSAKNLVDKKISEAAKALNPPTEEGQNQ